MISFVVIPGFGIDEKGGTNHPYPDVFGSNDKRFWFYSWATSNHASPCKVTLRNGPSNLDGYDSIATGVQGDDCTIGQSLFDQTGRRRSFVFQQEDPGNDKEKKAGTARRTNLAAMRRSQGMIADCGIADFGLLNADCGFQIVPFIVKGRWKILFFHFRLFARFF